MKLKGIELLGTYKVEYSNNYFRVLAPNGNQVYFEDSDGYWSKREYDSNGNEVYREYSDGTIIDKRVKKVSIELTQEQLDKIKHLL